MIKMASRYDDKLPRINNSKRYREIFKDRGVNYIRQYSTPELSHPNYKQIMELEQVNHVWKLGDRFYKIAAEYYGDEKLWWIIAWYNKKPTESHVKPGQILKVPSPISKVLSILRIK